MTYWGAEYWYSHAYMDGYLKFYKEDIIREITDDIYRESPIMQRLKKAPKRKQYRNPRKKSWQ